MEANNSPTSVKILRGILYLVVITVIIAIVGTLVYIFYYTGKNTMNVDMIVKDAFSKRAEVILQPTNVDADNEVLKGVFTEKYIARDPMLNNNPYDKYDVANYYQQTIVDSHITWQWEETAEFTATDTVRDIRGTYQVTDDLSAKDIALMDAPTIEKWTNAKYKVKMVKINNAWKIDNLELLENVEVEEKVKPTTSPEQSASQTPIASPEQTGEVETIPESVPVS